MSNGDVVMPMGANQVAAYPVGLAAAADLAQTNGWCRVFDVFADISAADTTRLVSGELLHDEMMRPVASPIPSTCAMTRDAWNTVGGYDERFGTGYGFEDCAIRNALHAKVGPAPSGGATVIRLDHGEGAPGIARVDEHNFKLFDREYRELALELN